MTCIDMSDVASDIALVKNNAVVGARIASHLCHLESEPSGEQAGMVVVGGANLDVICRPNRPLLIGDSNIGHVTYRCGGVGRNMAEAARRSGARVNFVSAVGQDMSATHLLSSLKQVGVNTHHITRSADHDTASFVAVQNAERDLHVAVNATRITEDMLTPASLDAPLRRLLPTAKLVAVDCNLTTDALAAVCDAASAAGVPVWVETTSTTKSVRITSLLHLVDYISPNVDEARAILAHHQGAATQGPRELAVTLLSCGVRKAALVHDAEGVAVAARQPGGMPSIFHQPAIPVARLVSTNGAGDTFAGAAAAALSLGATLKQAALHGITAAGATVSTMEAVASSIQPWCNQ
mmetsp:Transcript_51501/g.120838  ORF Transcript_51501/g.120838 Transcript_51501/m.120838 type:complete len:351 (-) Transcript_51501:27-1079(-)